MNEKTLKTHRKRELFNIHYKLIIIKMLEMHVIDHLCVDISALANCLLLL